MKQLTCRIPRPIVDFNPPVYLCKRADKPFTLDGNIHKDFWKDAPFTEDFVDIQGDSLPKPRFRTRAKMLWDDDNFYFAALLEGDEIWANVTERDDVIFRDNDFEIFIDPDSDTQQYYEFEMNARNTVWDLLLTKAYRDLGRAVNGFDIRDLRTAVYIDGTLNDPTAMNKFWSVEIVMPFHTLKECAADTRAPYAGDYWRVNFSRVQWLVDKSKEGYQKRINPETKEPYPEDNWVWAPTGIINIHYPELWGFVFFDDTPSKGVIKNSYSIPTDEKIKWQLRRLYYSEHTFKDRHGCFTSDIQLLENLQSENDSLEAFQPEPLQMEDFSVTIEVTKHSFEIRCLNSDKTAEIAIFADGKVTQITN